MAPRNFLQAGKAEARKAYRIMSKLFRVVAPALLFILFVAVFLAGNAALRASRDDDGPLSTDGVLVTEAPEIPEGVFYVRCSEPEENRFSIQFIGAVPTRSADYVGFEANQIYPDGTRGALTAVKLYTLYTEIEDPITGVTITPADFGMEDGYLFVRALDKIRTDQPDLSYEVAAFYVVGDEKIYTAKQTFSVEELLAEHILNDPHPIEIEEKSPLIDVQNWVRYTDEEIELAEGMSSDYYMGASAPDNNGNLDVYVCFALPDNLYNSVGIRYQFSMEDEENLVTVTTALSRIRTGVLYERVYSEKDILTIEDFGLTEGYLAVVCLSEYVNTVLREGNALNLVAYFSRNAIETRILDIQIDFSELLEKTVLVKAGVPVGTYTFIPTNYGDWDVFEEKAGNAEGEGALFIRVSRMVKADDARYFNVQLAAATPTRFAERISLFYTVYDENGTPVPEKIDKESEVLTLFGSIFGNSQEESITSEDFGIERGYLMSMLLQNVALAEADYTIGIRAVIINGEESTTLVSLRIPVQELVDRVPNYEG